VSVDAAGVERLAPTEKVRSIQGAVLSRPPRPGGLSLAVFSFSAADIRERQVVREALRLHGFQKLAQNAYVNGRVETRELEAQLERAGLSDRVFFLRCEYDANPSLKARLASLFDLAGRAQALRELQRDLARFLDAPRLRARELGSLSPV
jgi:DNA-binding transcriptional regulator PaaX